jgi:hypothetical protein
MPDYIVVRERGVKGADAPFFRELALTIPADWDKNFTLSANLAYDPDTNPYVYLLYNGLRYGHEFFNVNNNIVTWNHPYLDLDEGDTVSLWYVNQI